MIHSAISPMAKLKNNHTRHRAGIVVVFLTWSGIRPGYTGDVVQKIEAIVNEAKQLMQEMRVIYFDEAA